MLQPFTFQDTTFPAAEWSDVRGEIGSRRDNDFAVGTSTIGECECSTIIIIITSSCARSARFATCARSSLCSLCHCALQLFCVVE